MTREETIRWLNSLKKDIGQPQYQALWHYTEVIDMVIEVLSFESESCDTCKYYETSHEEYPCSDCTFGNSYYVSAEVVQDEECDHCVYKWGMKGGENE